jgi:hypothetical protein
MQSEQMHRVPVQFHWHPEMSACVRCSPIRIDQVNTAPQRPITVNGGFKMPGWYDVFSLGGDIEQQQDAEGLHDAAQCALWMLWKLVSRVAAVSLSAVHCGMPCQHGIVTFRADEHVLHDVLER